MSVSRMKSVGLGLTRVFAFFVLSNLFNMLVLKDTSRDISAPPGPEAGHTAEQTPACFPLLSSQQVPNGGYKRRLQNEAS